MVADLYRLSPNPQSVTEMRRRKPVKRVCLAQLNITPRSFREGFPGLDSIIEWFGLDIRFTINIPETATYEFMLLADDGAMLTVDDDKVIDNDRRRSIPGRADSRSRKKATPCCNAVQLSDLLARRADCQSNNRIFIPWRKLA